MLRLLSLGRSETLAYEIVRKKKNFFIASFAVVSQTTQFQLWCTAGLKVEKALN